MERKKRLSRARALAAALAVLLLLPGIAELLGQKKGAEGGAVSVVCYLLAMVLSIAVTFIMSTSDKLNAYYAKSDIMYD